MAVKLRLSRIGKKHAPFYRIVAIDSRCKRDGAALEVLGTYDGLKGTFVQCHGERIDYWLSQGAVPTDTVEKLYRSYRKAQASAA